MVTSDGFAIEDVLRIFYGDSPAAQFECGQNRAGQYICTSCTAGVSNFDDLPTCYRSSVVDLEHRQRFILKGTSWVAVKPLEGLKVQELRSEFRARGMIHEGKTKNELEKELNHLRKGIQKFPALLQPFPEKQLKDIHLDKYEISPCEPLHDIKGHMANLFEELPKHVSGAVETEVQKIKSTILNKDTLRCVDYRKAAVLLSKALHDTAAENSLVQLVDTLVEICEILYADIELRSPRSVLRLHNLTFIHGRLCVLLFYNPKAITKRKMFGKYFHSLTTHAPILNRIISLRSLNAELKELAFGEANAICRMT